MMGCIVLMDVRFVNRDSGFNLRRFDPKRLLLGHHLWLFSCIYFLIFANTTMVFIDRHCARVHALQAGDARWFINIYDHDNAFQLAPDQLQITVPHSAFRSCDHRLVKVAYLKSCADHWDRNIFKQMETHSLQIVFGLGSNRVDRPNTARKVKQLEQWGWPASPKQGRPSAHHVDRSLSQFLIANHANICHQY
jgi:hypothetical protein